MDESKRKADLAKFTSQVVSEPSKIRLLCDRVYDLLKDDLRQQKERAGNNYKGRL